MKSEEAIEILQKRIVLIDTEYPRPERPYGIPESVGTSSEGIERTTGGESNWLT